VRVKRRDYSGEALIYGTGRMLALPGRGAKKKADPSRRGGLGMTKQP